MNEMDQKYLSPTAIIDSDNKEIIEYGLDVLGDGAQEPIEKAIKLYYAVRDGIWYDPYYPFYLPEHYRSSNILKSGRGYCVCKASLLCAALRPGKGERYPHENRFCHCSESPGHKTTH